MNPTQNLAIIGAGPAGLAAAWALRDHQGLSITIFEKSRGVCGRATSRTRHGTRLDPGANFFKIRSPAVEALVLDTLPTDDLTEIQGDVWTFDREGTLTPGDAKQNAERKWTYRNGISQLGKLLAESAGAPILRKTRMEALRQSPEGWTLLDSTNAQHGPFDGVLLTPPAPQVVDLLENPGSSLRPPAADLVRTLEQSRYHRQFTFAFGLSETPPPRPGDFHALLNPDAGHPIAWLSFENDKPGHVPDGLHVVSVQMQPDWTMRFFETPVEELAPVVWKHATALLQWPAVEPAWFDSQRWKFAHPSNTLDAEASRLLEPDGLFLAGDALIGKGRVDRALESGLDAAARIRARIAG